MSSRTRRIQTAIEDDTYNMYHSLIGSAAVITGILSQFTESETKDIWQELKKSRKSLPDTPLAIFEHCWMRYSRAPKSLRKNVVLLYDANNALSPVFALTDDDGHIMPITRDKSMSGIALLASEGRDYVRAEYLYDENGNEFEEEE